MIEKIMPITENRYSNGVVAIRPNLEAPVGLVTDTLKDASLSRLGESAIDEIVAME